MLADWRTADVRPAMKAMLGFLEKMIERPEALDADDVAAVKAAGVSDAGLERAIYVCTAFTMIVRIADAFDFHVVSRADFLASARHLIKRGYTG